MIITLIITLFKYSIRNPTSREMPSTIERPILIDSDNDLVLYISPSPSNNEEATLINRAPVIPEHF